MKKTNLIDELAALCNYRRQSLIVCTNRIKDLREMLDFESDVSDFYYEAHKRDVVIIESLRAALANREQS